MDEVLPTAPVPVLGQVLGEMKFMQVTFNLFLPRSLRSSSNSLALHYDAKNYLNSGAKLKSYRTNLKLIISPLIIIDLS